MLHFISKLVTPLLSPANWILVFLLAFFIGKPLRWKRWYGWMALLTALLFTNPWLFFQCLQAWQVKPAKLEATYKAVLLPGGFSGYDKTGKGYFGNAADRFIQAAKLVNSGVAENIIVTGGNGYLNRKLPPEAAFVKGELISIGIDPSNIQLEAASKTTRENAQFTKQLLDSLNWNGPFILVTSAMHMRRCQLEFSKAGITTIAYPANYEMVDGFQQFQDWIWPDFTLLEKWGRLLKEMAGWLVSSF